METPNFYAIIPANVRYSKELSANAKLLYAEITALTSSNGECWASNAYFANLYNVSSKSISSWIQQLIKAGFLTSAIIYKDNSKEIKKRILRLANAPKAEAVKAEEEKKETMKANKENALKAEVEDLENSLSENLKESWQIWLTYKSNKKQSLTLITKKAQLKEIAKHKNIAKDVIQKSILNGWAGLFFDSFKPASKFTNKKDLRKIDNSNIDLDNPF